MRYVVHIVDMQHTIEPDTGFGTCDLCFFTADHEYDTFILEVTDEQGDIRTVEVENGFWCYGDYFTHIDLPENVIAFMVDFNARNITVDVELSPYERTGYWDRVLTDALRAYEALIEDND